MFWNYSILFSPTDEKRNEWLHSSNLRRACAAWCIASVCAVNGCNDGLANGARTLPYRFSWQRGWLTLDSRELLLYVQIGEGFEESLELGVQLGSRTYHLLVQFLLPGVSGFRADCWRRLALLFLADGQPRSLWCRLRWVSVVNFS